MDEWEGYESPPYCQHWYAPGDCDEVCACGHGCWQHDGHPGIACQANDCDCAGWVEPGTAQP